jgi:putative hydrolase of the HAD superfamily
MGRCSLEPAIKYVIFDIGGVLIELKRRHFLFELSRFIRQPLWRLKWPLDHEILNEITCGRKTVKDLFQFLGDTYDCPNDWDAFLTIWLSLLGKTMPGMEGFIQQLHAHYPLVILSNTNEPHFEYLKKNYPIFHYFSPSFLSYQMGLAKPDSRIFEAVLQQLQAEPHECFLIDDLPENIKAAQQMGIYVHHFKNTSLLKNKLQHINLL